MQKNCYVQLQIYTRFTGKHFGQGGRYQKSKTNFLKKLLLKTQVKVKIFRIKINYIGLKYTLRTSLRSFYKAFKKRWFNIWFSIQIQRYKIKSGYITGYVLDEILHFVHLVTKKNAKASKDIGVIKKLHNAVRRRALLTILYLTSLYSLLTILYIEHFFYVYV